MTNIFVNKMVFILLLTVYGYQIHAAAAAADPEAAPASHCTHGAYRDHAGGGERKMESPSIDEGWRWCQNLWVKINGNIVSFRIPHTEMREIEKKVSGAWNNIRTVIRRESVKEGKEEIDIGYGNLALAALTFVVEDRGVATPITVHVKDAAGAHVLFESGFKDTVMPGVASFTGSLPAGTPIPKDATKALKTLSGINLTALQEAHEDADALYVNIGRLFAQAAASGKSAPSPERLRELLAKVAADRATWKLSAGGGMVESKEESKEEATKPSIDLIHSEQVLRLFLQNPENLAPIFAELRRKMGELSMSAEASILQGILHIHSRVDMCPLCSTTFSTDCSSALENSIFARIFQIMVDSRFNVTSGADALLLVTSRDMAGRTSDPHKGIRRDTHGLPLVQHISPNRLRENGIRAFHRHPDAEMKPTPERPEDEAAARGSAGASAAGGAGAAAAAPFMTGLAAAFDEVAPPPFLAAVAAAPRAALSATLNAMEEDR